jgi:hypothetical protein
MQQSAGIYREKKGNNYGVAGTWSGVIQDHKHKKVIVIAITGNEIHCR